MKLVFGFSLLLFFGCSEEPNSPQVGSIEINSLPSSAIILLDGNQTGKITPTTLKDVPIGNHSITLLLSGYARFDTNVMVNEGTTANVYANLTLASGKIHVISNPSGAMIYLDNVGTGKITPDTINNVSVGDHEIGLYLSNYQQVTQQVNVLENQVITLNIELIPITVPMKIYSFPSGAEIYVDDLNTGLLTPAVAFIQLGQRVIKLIKSEHEAYIDSMTVNGGNDTLTIKAWIPIISKIVSSDANSITVDNNGNVYIGGNFLIEKYSPTLDHLWSFGSEGTGEYQFKIINDIEWAQGFGLHVLDAGRPDYYNNNRVIIYDENGNYEVSFNLPTVLGGSLIAWEKFAISINGDISLIGYRPQYLINPPRYAVITATGIALVNSDDLWKPYNWSIQSYGAFADEAEISILTNYGRITRNRLVVTNDFYAGKRVMIGIQESDITSTSNSDSVYIACQKLVLKINKSWNWSPEFDVTELYWSAPKSWFKKIEYYNGRIYAVGDGKLSIYDAF